MSSPPRAGTAGSAASSAIAVAASSGRSRHVPAIALLKTVISATERNEEATYGRSLTYSASANRPAPRPRRTSPTGSMSSTSAAVHRSSPASG